VPACGKRLLKFLFAIVAAGNRHVTYQTDRGQVIKDARVLDAGYVEVFNYTSQQWRF
jgi:hypothetical protein